MQNQINLTIECFQENGQDYYVATSPDIQGLVAEADTIDAAIDIAKDLIPILLELETDNRQSSSVTITTANQFQIPLLVS
jgi:predicted RNase H-like HicB family nuclease